MHSLDNPVWESLKSRHASLARMRGGAGRYPPEVAPFVAVASPEPGASGDLAALVDEGESVLFVGPCPGLPSGWSVKAPVPIAQMVCASHLDSVAGPDITELSGPQLADMLALTDLVYPHPGYTGRGYAQRTDIPLWSVRRTADAGVSG